MFPRFCLPKRVRTMPHSEVCMHMRIAGQPFYAEPIMLDSGEPGTDASGNAWYCAGIQLYSIVGNAPFSMPITVGEAGMNYDEIMDEFRFYYDAARDECQRDGQIWANLPTSAKLDYLNSAFIDLED